MLDRMLVQRFHVGTDLIDINSEAFHECLLDVIRITIWCRERVAPYIIRWFQARYHLVPNRKFIALLMTDHQASFLVSRDTSPLCGYRSAFKNQRKHSVPEYTILNTKTSSLSYFYHFRHSRNGFHCAQRLTDNHTGSGQLLFF